MMSLYTKLFLNKMDLYLVKTLNGSFKLAFDSDYEKAKQIPLNEPFLVKYTKQRNYKFHKKFFALVKLVFDNQEQYSFFDDLRHDLIIEAGYYYEYTDVHGEVKKKAKSISFSNMDETEFSLLYNSVVDVIVKYFSFDRQDIADNILQYF